MNTHLFLASLVLIVLCMPLVYAQGMGMDELYKLKDAKTRSISPENFTGEKGKGGMATLEEGNAARAARELGQGWKVNPYVYIEPGETFTLGEITGSGIINHIWMTPVGTYRHMILRFYWDGEEEPSVEAPVGDFFAAGWGMGNEPKIQSLAVCVNPKSGFNSYWQMPFREGAKVTMENMGDERASVYYQIDYSLEDVPEDTPYFHAQFRRTNPLPAKEVYTIVDGIEGRGNYVGTWLAHGAKSPGWWGEGEIKFFIDGDDEFPTICGTGEEDYFCGSYGYKEHKEDGSYTYDSFSTPYTGFYHVEKYDTDELRWFGQYRWHITDPVRFEEDLRITIQSLGWQSEGRYLPLEDDLASVAYWYQLEPHNPFPDLPSKEDLVIED
ncbi:MAG: glycoside hydrolase family 172 protein [Candidatus Hydrogenedentota bacterium]